MKKLTILFLIVCFLFTGTSTIKADTPDFSDDDYWQEACAVTPDTAEEMLTCNMYLQDYSTRLEESINDAESSIAEYYNLVNSVKSQIDAYNYEIETLNNNIDELNSEIDAYQNQIDTIYNNIRTRMSSSQLTMHFSSYVSFLMGASDFADIIKRVYIIDTMLNKEKTDSAKMQELKEEVQVNKEEVEYNLATVEDLKSEAAAKKEKYQDMIYTLNAKIEELENAKIEAAGLMSANEEALRQLNKYISSTKFTSPLTSYHFSAKVWGYEFGYHTGDDYAGNSIGTAVYAPANGVVVWSYDGCETVGYYGNSCGLTWGSGNCIYIMSEVGGRVYVFKFQHLQQGSITDEDIVFQGDVIARVGSSGTSTGAHVHIECFYLGKGAISDYISKKYDYTFGCYSQSTAMAHRCQYGASAPCRLDPDIVLTNQEWWNE